MSSLSKDDNDVKGGRWVGPDDEAELKAGTSQPKKEEEEQC